MIRRSIALWSVLHLSAGLLWTEPLWAENSEPSLRDLGEGYFKQFCASCHGNSAKGDGPVAPTLQKSPSDLTKISARRNGRFPVVEIKEFIDGRSMPPAHGTREMPVWGRTFSESVGGGTLGEEVVRGYLIGLTEYLKHIQSDPITSSE